MKMIEVTFTETCRFVGYAEVDDDFDIDSMSELDSLDLIKTAEMGLVTERKIHRMKQFISAKEIK